MTHLSLVNFIIINGSYKKILMLLITRAKVFGYRDKNIVTMFEWTIVIFKYQLAFFNMGNI